MRIPSGTTDQYVYFVAVDATDFTTRETGLSSFTVYRSRNGAAAAAMTTPTINETDATNMPGVYELLLDEDTTIAAGNDSEELALHITHAGMAPVTRTIELYRPKITEGNTLDVTATGAAGIDWGNVENPTTSVDLSATAINLCDTVTTNTDMRGTDNAFLAASAPPNFGDFAITATTGLVSVGTNNDKTGYALTQSFPTNFADMAITATTGLVTAGSLGTQAKADVNAECDTAISDASLATAAALATVDNNVDAILLDTGTDGVVLAGTPDVNVAQISGDSTAADNLGESATAIVVGAAITGTLSTTQMTTNLTETTDDHYIGRTIIWTTGVLANQATDITDYDGTSKMLTFTATTEAPSNTDTFVIV